MVNVIEAHQFPFVVDDFISTLVIDLIKTIAMFLFVVPGSLYSKKLNKEFLGYYSWLVTIKGLGVHRSFTIRDYSSDDDFANTALYKKQQIKEELLKEDPVTNYVASEKETITTNDRFVSITDSRGNIYKLLFKDL